MRPTSDLGLYLAGAAGLAARENSALDPRQRPLPARILDLLGSSGPPGSRDIPDTRVVPWALTGDEQRNVTEMLECLILRGEIAIAGRVGRERLWDLAERVYPAGVAVPLVEEAERLRNERRLGSLGIARQKARRPGPVLVGEAASGRGRGREGRVARRPAALVGDFEGRTALLSPFIGSFTIGVSLEPFDFDYTLEMYNPAAKRRRGYYALPIFHDAGWSGRSTPPPTESLRACGWTDP